MKNLLLLAKIARPVSWVNTAYPFGAGYIVAGGHVNALWALGCVFFLIPYNLFMYGVNDVFDYESDILNPRKGGIEGAQAAKAFHPTILRAVVITNVPFIVALLALGTLRSAAALAVVLFFVLAYSAPKLRFKERPFLDSVTSSIHFVGPLVFALSLLNFPSTAWPYVLAFFLWGMASHAFGAIQDIIPDREGKLASIGTVMGARTTLWFAIVCYSLSAVILCSQGLAGCVVGVVELSYITNLLVFIRVTDDTSGGTNRGWRRFIWLNYFAGFVVTMVLIVSGYTAR